MAKRLLHVANAEGLQVNEVLSLSGKFVLEALHLIMASDTKICFVDEIYEQYVDEFMCWYI